MLQGIDSATNSVSVYPLCHHHNRSFVFSIRVFFRLVCHAYLHYLGKDCVAHVFCVFFLCKIEPTFLLAVALSRASNKALITAHSY